MANRLHLTETREQLTPSELTALDVATDAAYYALRELVPVAGDDRLAIVEQTIGDFIIASRGAPVI